MGRTWNSARPIGALLLVALLGSTAVVADDGVAAQTNPGVPRAEDCDAQEADLNEIGLLLELPVLYILQRPSQQTAVDPASAQPGIEELNWTSVSCVNANQPLRWLSLFTERYWLERFGPDHPDDFEAFRAASSREPEPADGDDLLEILAVDEAEPAADERWSVVVTTQNSESRFIDELIVVWDGESWFIDELRAGDELPPLDDEA